MYISVDFTLKFVHFTQSMYTMLICKKMTTHQNTFFSGVGDMFNACNANLQK